VQAVVFSKLHVHVKRPSATLYGTIRINDVMRKVEGSSTSLENLVKLSREGR